MGGNREKEINGIAQLKRDRRFTDFSAKTAYIAKLILNAEGFNQVNLTMAANPGLSRIFVVGMDDPDRLNDIEAAQFANLMRAITNQGAQRWTQFRLGLIDEIAWERSANQIAQILSTPGGMEYLESNKVASSEYFTALEPYMGQEMQSNFSLGRDPADF